MKPFSKEKYADWFGSGTTENDYADVVKEHGEPQRVFQYACMIVLLYADKAIIVGYDGNEYWHEYECDEVEKPS